MEEDQLIGYETAKLAKEGGFNWLCKLCFAGEGSTPLPYKIGSARYNNGSDYESAPTQTTLQKWLRKTHNIHINIRYEEYFHVSDYKYFHYDISHNELNDVTGNEDLFGDIMDECSQDIQGNYLSDEKFSKLIFERGFAFKGYEEALEHGLQKALKLIK